MLCASVQNNDLPGGEEDLDTSAWCTRLSAFIRTIWLERRFWNMEFTVDDIRHHSNWHEGTSQMHIPNSAHLVQVLVNGKAVYGVVQMFVFKSTCIGLFGKRLLSILHSRTNNCAIFMSQAVTPIDTRYGFFGWKIHVFIAILNNSSICLPLSYINELFVSENPILDTMKVNIRWLAPKIYAFKYFESGHF